MALSKKKRAEIKQMFGGNCAYCGHALGDRWHADHVIAVLRKIKYVVGKDGYYRGQTVGFYRPENDVDENIFPACIPCNIDKSSGTIEDFRKGLRYKVTALRNNHAGFRHLERFNLVSISEEPIVFYFEKLAAESEAVNV